MCYYVDCRASGSRWRWYSFSQLATHGQLVSQLFEVNQVARATVYTVVLSFAACFNIYLNDFTVLNVHSSAVHEQKIIYMLTLHVSSFN